MASTAGNLADRRLVLAAVRITKREKDRVPMALLFDRLDQAVSKRSIRRAMEELGAPYRINVNKREGVDALEPACFVGAVLREPAGGPAGGPVISDRVKRFLALFTITGNAADTLLQSTVLAHARKAGLSMSSVAVRDHLERAGAVFNNNTRANGTRARGFLMVTLASPDDGQ